VVNFGFQVSTTFVVFGDRLLLSLCLANPLDEVFDRSRCQDGLLKLLKEVPLQDLGS
jgi:hypothetical protein